MWNDDVRYTIYDIAPISHLDVVGTFCRYEERDPHPQTARARTIVACESRTPPMSDYVSHRAEAAEPSLVHLTFLVNSGYTPA